MSIKCCLVGGCPSSGSTYLADLLDSTNYSVCGPEIGIFAIKEFYKKNYKLVDFDRQSITASPHSSGVHLYNKFLPYYGLDKNELIKIISSSKNHEDFFKKFSTRFSNFRNKKNVKIFFEKTPQNIFILDSFLKRSTNGNFIFITRNPIDNIQSLQRRGYSFKAAAMTWLVFMAAYKKYKKTDRVFFIKYEDILDEPYQSVSILLKDLINVELDSNEIEKNYKNNLYRELSESRISSWTKNKGTVNKEKTKNTELSYKYIDFLLNLKLSKEYAHVFGLPEISFEEAIDISGYKEEVENNVTRLINSNNKKMHKDVIFSFHFSELKLLLGKHFRTSSFMLNFFKPHKFVNSLKIRS